MPILSLIAAMADNRVIGVENRLPWSLPEDMKWFRRHTLGKPVVMGRLTFESIGRPLPQRSNIVITGNSGWAAEGCEVVHDVEGALRAAEPAPEVMVIGGASLYAQLLPRADRLYLTLVHADIEGDAWFPSIDFAEWRELERSDGEGGGYRYSFVILERLPKAGT